jgi:hypothetical protein
VTYEGGRGRCDWVCCTAIACDIGGGRGGEEGGRRGKKGVVGREGKGGEAESGKRKAGKKKQESGMCRTGSGIFPTP